MPNFTQRIPFRGALHAAQNGMQRTTAFVNGSVDRALTNSVARSAHDPQLTGGYTNPRTGAGTERDSGIWAGYKPTLDLTRSILETIYTESWAARKFIDIPVNDANADWRVFDNDAGEKNVAAMKEAERRHNVSGKIAELHQLGRLFGTGLLIIVTRNTELKNPLDIDNMKKGDLANLITSDRYLATVKSRYTDVHDPKFGQPEVYEVQFAEGVRHEVHASRVLRVDGIALPNMVEGSTYNQDWGSSEIIPVMFEIMRDNGLVTSIAHLADEASVSVMRIHRFSEALAGEQDRDKASPTQKLADAMRRKSNFRTIMMDKDDEFERVHVNFGALPELMDRFAERMAAAANIPATRFMGQAPKGMNATGVGDMRNYALTIKSMQRKKLNQAMSVLDQVLAKDAGIRQPPAYIWKSIMDLSEKEKADVAFKKVQAVVAVLNQFLISPEEGRKVLSGDDIFGVLDENPDFPLGVLANTMNAEGDNGNSIGQAGSNNG